MNKHERLFQLLGGEFNKDKISYIHMCPKSNILLKLRNGQEIKKIPPNEAYFFGSTLIEVGDAGRDKRMEKLKVLLNGMQDISFMSNKDMMITHMGHFTPSIGHGLLIGDIIVEILKIERQCRIEMKAKMGYPTTFPIRGIKNSKIMGGVGIMELNDIQVQRRIN